jgi:hypothetical protein
MFEHVNVKTALLCAVPAVTALTLAGSAAASPSPSLAFSASKDGASAQWSSGQGSPIDLTLGSSASSFAEISLRHVESTKVSQLSEPTFTTDNYNSGSPRYYITLNNGHTLWGYPPNSGLSSDFAWAIDNGNTYLTWSTVQSDEGTAKVSGAFVIADADQSAGTEDVITALTFGSTTYN